MKLRFEKQGDFYCIHEDGKDTDKVKFEFIGHVSVNDPKCLMISKNYSGIMDIDEMEQIVNFVKNAVHEQKSVPCINDDAQKNRVQKCECCNTTDLGDDYATANDGSVLCGKCSEDKQ